MAYKGKLIFKQMNYYNLTHVKYLRPSKKFGILMFKQISVYFEDGRISKPTMFYDAFRQYGITNNNHFNKSEIWNIDSLYYDCDKHLIFSFPTIKPIEDFL